MKDNTLPPEPIQCSQCDVVFYGRKGADCCSARCRKRKQYKKIKGINCPVK